MNSMTPKIAALYCRLSKNEGLDNESNSIANQKVIVAKAAMMYGYEDTQFFIDDGYNGIGFERSALQRLEDAIQAGYICAVIVKEIAGLRWSAISFENDTIAVEHTVTKFKTVVAKDGTKNHSSHRVLPLNREVKTYLLRLRARQSQDKLLLGQGYQDTDYICRWPDGHAMRCDYLSRAFKRLLVKHGLPDIRLHDLRHSCASYMLKMGCTMKEVADWLGHADIKTAMNVYAHLDMEAKKGVADKFGSLLSV